MAYNGWKMMDKAVLIGESHEAAYEKDGKVCSAYQRNEVVSLWEKDGKRFVTVRNKTAHEQKEQREKEHTALQKAIAAGKAVRDRIGRIRWIKH